MSRREELRALGLEGCIELILALEARQRELLRRVEELEARLNRPPKGPHNSSVPPSRGQKANGPVKPNPNQRRQAHGQGGRPLAESFDELKPRKTKRPATSHTHQPLLAVLFFIPRLIYH